MREATGAAAASQLEALELRVSGLSNNLVKQKDRFTGPSPGWQAVDPIVLLAPPGAALDSLRALDPGGAPAAQLFRQPRADATGGFAGQFQERDKYLNDKVRVLAANPVAEC